MFSKFWLLLSKQPQTMQSSLTRIDYISWSINLITIITKVTSALTRQGVVRKYRHTLVSFGETKLKLQTFLYPKS